MNDAPGELLARNDEVWLEGIEADLARAADALCAMQRDDGHWVFELEADATIPAEYILLRQHLGEPEEPVLERKIGNYLRRIQGEHGGWPLFHGGAFDLSASVKAYFCLKMIGDDPDAPHMARARAAILAHGGAGRANVFTRMLLCLYGELSWKRVPTIPVEMILMPRWFPMHISRMSYWARTVLVPLLVLQAMRARARNPRGVRIPELFVRCRLRRRRTRTQFALFGLMPWRAVPVMPVEIMLLPKWFPFHLDKISYWARCTLVPTMSLAALKPVARNPRGVHIDELFAVPADEVRDWPKGPQAAQPWSAIFGAVNAVLLRVERFFPRGHRRRALEAAVAYLRERINGEDGVGAIYPAIAGTVMLFDALGVSRSDPDYLAAREAIERLMVVNQDEAYCQPCL